jgi:hypothetical protein
MLKEQLQRANKQSPKGSLNPRTARTESKAQRRDLVQDFTIETTSYISYGKEYISHGYKTRDYSLYL